MGSCRTSAISLRASLVNHLKCDGELRASCCAGAAREAVGAKGAVLEAARVLRRRSVGPMEKIEA